MQKSIFLSQIAELESHAPINCLAIAPDECSIVTGHDDCSFSVWNSVSGKLIHKIKIDEGPAIRKISICPNNIAVVFRFSGAMYLYNLATGEYVRELVTHYYDLSIHEKPDSMTLSPDGRFILAGTGNKVLHLWDLTTSQVIRCLGTYRYGSIDRETWHTINTVNFTSDGRFGLSSWNNGRNAAAWDLSDGKLTCEFEGHTEKVWCIVASPDSSRVLSGSDDKTVRLWNLDGSCIRSFDHISGVHFVEFSPNGRLVAAISFGGIIRIWDSATGRLVSEAEFPSSNAGYATSFAFARNWGRLITGYSDRFIRVWKLQWA